MKNIKAVILAGGLGTRLYPITYEIPKPLLPIRKKPIINYLVDLFLEQGIKEIAILINKGFEEDFNWWKKRYYPKKKIRFFKEKKPLGTLGGLYYLKKWISKSDFFLTNGDELKKIDLRKMRNFHQKKEMLATIALVKVKDPQDYGVVLCKNGIVQEFLEKPGDPPTKYINSGLYIFSPGIFKYHPGPKFSMIETNLFPKLAKAHKLAGFKFRGKWTDCGTWGRYEHALKHWK
ncbi:nucleotidyltransferase family protein [bacterium]|nr:nucleotidyltransferase family protein [bacterium]